MRERKLRQRVCESGGARCRSRCIVLAHEIENDPALGTKRGLAAIPKLWDRVSNLS